MNPADGRSPWLVELIGWSTVLYLLAVALGITLMIAIRHAKRWKARRRDAKYWKDFREAHM